MTVTNQENESSLKNSYKLNWKRKKLEPGINEYKSQIRNYSKWINEAIGHKEKSMASLVKYNRKMFCKYITGTKGFPTMVLNHY